MNKLPALEDIRVFTVAARLKGFAKAAEQLCVSPAYVSKRIKLLEDNLGLTLFFRSPRAVNLTREGEIVLQTSLQMLDSFELMRNELQASRVQPRGLLRISCSTGFGTEYLNPFILWLRDSHPLLSIDLTLVDRPVDIASENVDLDICLGGIIPPQYIARRIASNHRIFCVSPAYIEQYGIPVVPKDLEHKHVCISIRERNHNHTSLKIECGDDVISIVPNGQLTVNNGNVAKEWCLNGQGVLLRSIWSVREELSSGRLIRVLPEWQQTADVYAVYSSKTETSANLRVFIARLEQYLQLKLSVEATENGV